MNKQNLLRLAAHLENGRPGGHEVFDFRFVHIGEPTEIHCGTRGCALGELPAAFPEASTFRPELHEG